MQTKTATHSLSKNTLTCLNQLSTHQLETIRDLMIARQEGSLSRIYEIVRNTAADDCCAILGVLETL